MKKICLTIFLCFVCSSAWAGSINNISQKASRQTTWNNVTDFFATVGKSENEKDQIKRERRETRRIARLKKETQSQNARTQKNMKKQQKIIMEKLNAGQGHTTIGL